MYLVKTSLPYSCLYIKASPALGLTQSVHAKICIRMHQGQILNFQNTFDRACDEIRLEI